MTYNLRYASAAPPNSWKQRRPLVREMIAEAAPDIIGTQEGLHSQLNDLAADLPDYDWTGVGRDGETRGEFMAVFYRRSRFEPLATNHFWLSDTPEIPGSKTWGPKFARMVTTLKLRDRQNGREFYFYNTHLDHEVQLARERSAELIRRRVSELPTGVPILLVGDFNAQAAGNRAYEILVADDFFRDTWQMAKSRRGEGIGTFNNFKRIENNGVRIDWILLRGAVVIESSEILTFSRDGQFPSDHFPVVATLEFLTKN